MMDSRVALSTVLHRRLRTSLILGVEELEISFVSNTFAEDALGVVEEECCESVRLVVSITIGGKN